MDFKLPWRNHSQLKSSNFAEISPKKQQTETDNFNQTKFFILTKLMIYRVDERIMLFTDCLYLCVLDPIILIPSIF